ncbi:ATP-binding protein [Bacteriovorax sp. DB6_IX]|uniref:sensor histidine kinase n=1 Tax=Bacteriovorax sp. DB6_IX TaxID=1353530 RepID=UPI00038A2BEC|nr:ATP-binding protein [Bacteriovorax sp. DB6_IX]EQC48597.1 GHKL domain protein [Bacteriovorax sp. DB6_IX]
MFKEWFRSRLSFMLLKYILITSSFFTFLSTMIQVYIDYSSDLNTIYKTINQVENSYSSSLANSLWHLDNDQIEVQLSGILKLRDVEFIQILEHKSSGKSVFMEMGNKNVNRKIEKSFLLKYGQEEEAAIGQVVIMANLDHVYDRILDRVFIILITQTIKTFLVSSLILFIIYITVAKKIILISKYAEDLTHKNIDNELKLNPSFIDEVNEIDDLISSLNRMRLNLRNYIKNRDEAENQLKDYKSHLEELVLKRTKQLNDKNTILESKIDEINKMQDQLIAQEKLASLGNLTSGIAHEINNPLNFIINFAQVSKDSVSELYDNLQTDPSYTTEKKDNLIEEVEDLKNMVTEITVHGKRAEQIVKSMLEHSRTGDETNIKEKANIHEIIEENLNFAFHAMRAKYRGFHINFSKNYDNDVKELDVVKGDIARVFLNLFSNAFYSMIKKTESRDFEDYIPELVITTHQEKGLITIKIRDNGLGFNKATAERIFNPFYTTKPTGEGTGLGLSLSFEIVTGLHGGQMMANGEPGRFAEFTIKLPCA